MEQSNPNISAEDVQAAEHAWRLEADALQKAQNAVLEQVKAMVSPKAYKQIEEILFDSGLTHTYLIADQALGLPQDENFELGEVYLNQTIGGGICGDDYSGTMSMPLGKGRFFQFSYAS
jgi:hypothetical protein